jgi:hypothetical protein
VASVISAGNGQLSLVLASRFNVSRTEAFAFPGHCKRCQMPIRISGHAAEIGTVALPSDLEIAELK